MTAPQGLAIALACQSAGAAVSGLRRDHPGLALALQGRQGVLASLLMPLLAPLITRWLGG